jgi:2-dehydropantoate 2-reductase
MKVLVLGAGATGGYFGGRLAQSGADVTFLVRERRARQLAADGLVIKSPHGDFTLAVNHVLQTDVRPEYDVVLLACKAYDLDASIESMRPAMKRTTHVLPVLNGLAHIDRLRVAFGDERVVGGTCHIAGAMSPAGEIRQMSPLHRITYGVLPRAGGDAPAKLEALHDLFKRTQVDAVLSDDIERDLWEKFVLLTSLATMTCLMRANVGEILAAGDGEALMGETLETCRRIAEASGHAPREQAMAGARKLLFDRASTFAASMLRDMESGNRIEGDHIVGDMLTRGRAAGIEPGPLRAAYCHLQAYEARRKA